MSGHVIQQHLQVRIFPAEVIRPTNHSSPLFFGRTAPAPVLPQPFWIGRVAPQLAVLGEEISPRSHDQLHRFRTGYQTVGQPLWMFDYHRRWDADVEQIQSPKTDLTPYRQSSAVVVTQLGQPWWMWQSRAGVLEAAPEPRGLGHDVLHRYRVGYQTVGQPMWLWDSRVREVPLVEVIVQPRHTELNLYRVGYQTVGQPWYMWQPIRVATMQEVGQEPVPGPRPRGLFDYRAITVIVVSPPNLHRLLFDMDSGQFAWLVSGVQDNPRKFIYF